MTGLITKIGSISDGTKPQMGPNYGIPFMIAVRTTGGPAFLEITEEAAAELRDALAASLQDRVKGSA